MSDLTDEDIARCDKESDFTTEDFWSLLAEVKRHRAAVAADEERVRSVVRQLIISNTDLADLTDYQIDNIAGRAAKQLASAAMRPGPRCTECSRFRLTSDGENYDARCVCGHLATVRP